MKTTWPVTMFLMLVLVTSHETAFSQELATGVWFMEIERPTAPVEEKKLIISKTADGYEAKSLFRSGRVKPIDNIHFSGKELCFERRSMSCLLTQESETASWKGTCPPNATPETPGALTISLSKQKDPDNSSIDSNATNDTTTVGTEEAAADSGNNSELPQSMTPDENTDEVSKSEATETGN